MNKKIKNLLIITIFSLIFLTGCDSKAQNDDHYKPEEFKHNVAINNASNVMESVNDDIFKITGKTPIDQVVNTYKNSITRLNEQITFLETTQKKLSEDKALSKNEVNYWNDSYNSMIKSVKSNIKSIEKKQEELYK